MGKNQTRTGQRNSTSSISMGRAKKYSTKLKIIITTLVIFGSFATLFQFLPTQLFHFSNNVTPSCSTHATTTTPSPPQQPTDKILKHGVIRKSFYPVGTAAYNFIFMSAYRGGTNTFAIIGLSSKPLHDYGHPSYTCEYQSNTNSSKVPAKKLEFRDFGYARVYLVVVLNCTFPSGTTDNADAGGRLLLHASTNGGYDSAVNSTDTIIALTEPPNSWEPSQFLSPPRYDYLYCGGSLFGSLSPQRIREWISYHVRLFGHRSHFVIHDAGGVHREVFDVLQPWIDLGYVTVEDVNDEESFDGFYHNQMLVLNDCLHRYRFSSKWMFFFDVDEYIYLPRNGVLEKVMDSLHDYSLVMIRQVSMSNQLCLAQDSDQVSKYVRLLSLS